MLSVLDKINKLIQYLNRYRSFLVIDGIEVLLDGREWKNTEYFTFFSNWQEQGKNSVIILTSQEIPTLLGEASWYNLQGLSQEAGSKLLGLKLRLDSAEFHAKQVELEKISQSLDGHPLALRLVASYLSSYCGDGTDFCNSNILERTREAGLLEFPAIVEVASGVHRGEQTCLERVLKRHLESLTSEQLLILTSLSVYRLPFTLDAATEIIDNSTSLQILKILAVFVQCSLLTKEQGYYSIQPSIQRYIQTCVDVQLDAHYKAIVYYQKNLTSEPWDDITDITYHIELFYHQHEIKDYFGAFATVETIADFIKLKGYILSLSEMYEKLNSNWHITNTNQKEICTVWNKLGDIFSYLGLIESSYRFYQQALHLSRDIEEKYCEAVALKGLGDYHEKPGSFCEAILYYKNSLEIAQAISARNLEVEALYSLGQVHFARGEYYESIDAHERALKRHRSVTIKSKRERKIELDIIFALGVSYKWQHQFSQAETVHLQLLSLARNYASKKHEYDAFFGLGFINLSTQKYEESIGFYQKALEIAKEIGNQYAESVIFSDLGRIMTACERYSEALHYNDRALEILSRMGERRYMASTLNYRANTYRALKNYDEAINLYNQSINIAREANYIRKSLRILIDLGIAYENMNQFEEAQRVYQEVIQIAKKTEYKHEEALAYLFQSRSFAESRSHDSGLTDNERARKLFQQMGIKDIEKDCPSVIHGYNERVIPYKAPSIENTKIRSSSSSEANNEAPEANAMKQIAFDEYTSSDLSNSLSLALYSIAFLFIVANLIQGHHTIAVIMSLATIIFGLYKFSKRR